MEYKRASEAQSIGTHKAIPRWHNELKNHKIAYVEVDAMNKLGDPVYAKIKIASALEKHLSGYDIVLIVNAETWRQFNDKQRLALIDHELEHITVDEMTGNLVRRNHDLEEFSSIARRHGLWEKGLKLFAEHLAQLDLFKAATGSEDGDRFYGASEDSDANGEAEVGVEVVTLSSGDKTVAMTGQATADLEPAIA